MAYRKKMRHPALVVTHRRTRRPLRRPSAHNLRSFRRRLTLWGPLAPCSSLCCRTSHEHLSGTIGKGYLSSCRLKATICLLGDTPARVLVTKRVSPADTSRSRGILLSPSIPRTFTLRVRLPSGTSEAFRPTSGPLRPHLLFELEDQDSFRILVLAQRDTTFGFSNTLATN